VDGAATKPESCTALAVKLVPHGVASGSTYWDLVVTNRGKADCILPASPQLGFTDPDHKPQTVKISADRAAKPFQLAIGATAAMIFRYGSDYNPPCYGQLAYLRVTPPGAELPLGGFANCANGSASVGTWVAGSHPVP
jgi:hypothetical protein